MHLLPIAAIGFLLVGAGGSSAVAQSSAGVATVAATFSQRSTVRASVTSLEFHVITPDQPATASIEFVASARTSSTAEVRLLVEPVGAISGPGGAADVEIRLALERGGEGIAMGEDVPLSAPTTAARWMGSGQRRGRLEFSLRASAPGWYSVPLSLVLSVW
jgi:hypothetical protein